MRNGSRVKVFRHDESRVARGVDRVFIRVITRPTGRHAQKGRSGPLFSIPSLLALVPAPTSPPLHLHFDSHIGKTEAALACERYSLLIMPIKRGSGAPDIQY